MTYKYPSRNKIVLIKVKQTYLPRPVKKIFSTVCKPGCPLSL